MAVHHPATIVPSKLDLLRAWVPGQPWAGDSDTSTLTRLGSYRFDDPDGEVGIETHLLGTADGGVLQVPLTYRGAPREAASEPLVTTMTHTLLGRRWIYDGCHDPVYVTALVTAVVTGGRHADLYTATDGGLVLETATTHVRGSGSRPTVAVLSAPAVRHDRTVTRIDAGVSITVPRLLVPGTPARPGGATVLEGTWPGQDEPVVLAWVHSTV